MTCVCIPGVDYGENDDDDDDYYYLRGKSIHIFNRKESNVWRVTQMKRDWDQPLEEGTLEVVLVDRLVLNEWPIQEPDSKSITVVPFFSPPAFSRIEQVSHSQEYDSPHFMRPLFDFWGTPYRAQSTRASVNGPHYIESVNLHM